MGRKPASEREAPDLNTALSHTFDRAGQRGKRSGERGGGRNNKSEGVLSNGTCEAGNKISGGGGGDRRVSWGGESALGHNGSWRRWRPVPARRGGAGSGEETLINMARIFDSEGTPGHRNKTDSFLWAGVVKLEITIFLLCAREQSSHGECLSLVVGRQRGPFRQTRLSG